MFFEHLISDKDLLIHPGHQPYTTRNLFLNMSKINLVSQDMQHYNKKRKKRLSAYQIIKKEMPNKNIVFRKIIRKIIDALTTVLEK